MQAQSLPGWCVQTAWLCCMLTSHALFTGPSLERQPARTAARKHICIAAVPAMLWCMQGIMLGAAVAEFSPSLVAHLAADPSAMERVEGGLGRDWPPSVCR